MWQETQTPKSKDQNLHQEFHTFHHNFLPIKQTIKPKEKKTMGKMKIGKMSLWIYLLARNLCIDNTGVIVRQYFSRLDILKICRLIKKDNRASYLVIDRTASSSSSSSVCWYWLPCRDQPSYIVILLHDFVPVVTERAIQLSLPSSTWR